MISSIFNSRPGLKLLLWLFLLLLLGEGSIRIFEERLSWDVTHWKEMPDLLRNLSKTNAKKILFLGNSLTRRNVKQQLIEKELNHLNKEEVAIARIFPDDTTIIEWPYILQSQSIDKKLLPDILVIIFFQGHLQDSPLTSENIRRIGYFSSLSSVPEIVRKEMLSIDQSMVLLLSKASALFRNKERIQKRTLDFLPYYRKIAAMVNLQLVSKASKESKARTYWHLNHLLQIAKHNNIHVLFSPAPILKRWEMDPRAEYFILAKGMTVLDVRGELSLSEEDFLDGYHLSPRGATKFSIIFGEKLKEFLETRKTGTE